MTLHRCMCPRRLAAAALLAWLATDPAAQAVAGSVRAATAPTEDERLRILNAELEREQHKAAEAASRRDERMVARDPQGAREADQAQRRSLEDIAALQREIASVSDSLRSSSNSQAPAPSARRSAPSFRDRGDVPAPPWWDVYAKPPRGANPVTTRPSSPARPDTAAFQPQPRSR